MIVPMSVVLMSMPKNEFVDFVGKFRQYNQDTHEETLTRVMLHQLVETVIKLHAVGHTITNHFIDLLSTFPEDTKDLYSVYKEQAVMVFILKETYIHGIHYKDRTLTIILQEDGTYKRVNKSHKSFQRSELLSKLVK